MPDPVSLGSKWLPKLVGMLGEISAKRQAELTNINNILGIDPKGLAPLYIEPFCQTVNPANLDEDDAADAVRMEFHKWADAFFARSYNTHDGRHVTFILADAGMGKTCLLAMLKLTDLGRFWPKGTQMELLKLGPDTLEQISELERPADTILLLDSLDEDRTAWSRVEERLGEILEATSAVRQVVVTCRTQFFPKEAQLEENGRIRIGGYTCKLFYLSPFSDDQVEEYLEKRFPNSVIDRIRKWRTKMDNAKREDARKVLEPMRSLRMRPMLLSRIEDLMEADVKEWDPYRVHKALVDVWLDREIRRLGSEGKVTAEELLETCREMAFDLQFRGERLLTEAELGEMIQQKNLSYKITEVEFGGQSLLNRNSDGDYRFAHFSVQEFLVADRVIEQGIGQAELQLTDQLAMFLSSWLGEPSSLGHAWQDRSSLAEREWGNLFLEMLRAGYHRWAPGSDLSGADLKDASLAFATLPRADLTGAKLTGAKLTGAMLKDAKLKDADLTGADLYNADLTGADLTGAKLLRAKLKGAMLKDAKLKDADLLRAKLRDADLLCAKLKDADLRSADLTGANLFNADLTYADLTGAKLTDAKLKDADLTGADLTGADLFRAKLKDAKLTDAGLFNADLTYADLTGADLTGAHLKDAKLTGAVFFNADLTGADPQLPVTSKRKPGAETDPGQKPATPAEE